MGFQDIAFLPSRASFPHFLNIVVEVKASGHVFKLCLGVSKGMLPV